MAAPFLLVVSGGAAAGGEDEAGLPLLELRGIDDQGRGRASVAAEEPLLIADISTHDDEPGQVPLVEFRGINDFGPAHTSFAPEEPVFMAADVAADEDEDGEEPLLSHRRLSATEGSCGSHAGVRETKTVSEEGPLAVYVVDAVLLPSHLRQKLDGGDEPLLRASRPTAISAGCTPCCAWAMIPMAVVSIVGFHVAFLLQDALDRKNKKANLSGY
ncbi:hypothetical protein VPH35_027827 [Triticum aestivum]